MARLFGTDGIRGIAYTELTEELAKSVGSALVEVLGAESETKVLIGLDTRESSEDLGRALAEGICLGGADAYIVGVCSTPAVAYLVKKLGFNAGVMISASHNPYQFNGIKIFASDGYKLSDETEDKIEEIIKTGTSTNAAKKGKIEYLKDARNEYSKYLISAFGVSIYGLKIGIDCANGSASATAKEVFESLGGECVMLANTPNGKNINNNCGSTHPQGLVEKVKELGLDLGIAFDGDADRCIAIDENGREIDGDYIMAVLSLWLKSKGKLNKDTVVGTVMSNLGFIKFCEANNLSFVATKVGDRYVLEEMLKNGYNFGGEQSGHLIFSDLATTGDGQLTAIALVSLLKESGKKLSELSDVMKKFPQYMVNISANAEEKAMMSQNEEILSLIKATEKKLEGSGRLVIRPSGTEPLVRIMAEGESLDVIKELCDGLAKEISEIFKK